MFTSAGKALVRRVGRRLSSITNTPRSLSRRINAQACSLSLVCRSVHRPDLPSSPGRKQNITAGIRSKTISHGVPPARQSHRTASVPEQLSGSPETWQAGFVNSFVDVLSIERQVALFQTGSQCRIDRPQASDCSKQTGRRRSCNHQCCHCACIGFWAVRSRSFTTRMRV